MQVVLVPGFEIAPERQVQQYVEILVGSAETEREERRHVFLVTAGVLERDLQAAPVGPVPVGGIHREIGLRRTAVKPKIGIGANLEIAVLARLRMSRSRIAQDRHRQHAKAKDVTAGLHAK